MAALGHVGPYELVRWIEAGGMGEIFLAVGPTPKGRDLLAVKRLLPHARQDQSFVRMFLDEGRLTKLLKHPNICQVFELGEADGEYYLAMEWVDGVSFKTLLTRARAHGLLPIDVTAKIVIDTARALDYAHRLTDAGGHSLRIVHRDVSPPNIMVGLDGRVKLLDFGLAKARTQLSKTQPGTVKGKFGYLAPEQLSGHVSHRTDIFSLGLCMYEALTGVQLFDQVTAAETVTAIKAFRGTGSLRAVRSDVWPSLDAIVQRACAPDPRERFESAHDMRLAIEQALATFNRRPDEARVASVVRGLFPERRSERPPPPAPPPIAEPDVYDGDAASHVDELAAALERSDRRRTTMFVAAGATMLVVGGAILAWLALSG
jgi:serine/threonine protein kinase